MQAAFQEYTDNAVSKTINFSHDATVEDVAEAYRSAYTLGCKGITVYRDGSKAEQVLSTGNAVQESGEGSLADPDDPDAVKIIGLGSRVPRRRPRQIHGITERVRTGHGNMYVTVNMDSDGLPFEVFGAMGKAGGCDAALLEAVSRLVSLALRAGIEPSEVTRQLRGITCCPAWDNGVLVGSGPDAVALVLDNIASGGNARDGAPAGVQLSLAGGPTENGTNGYSSAPTYPAGFSQRCPECNGGVVNQEGCLTCYSCGWNKCE
jgi:ribonucleoside-diphosphate reductase alpha chain